MAPDMAISMRHSKLKAAEAALLAGELKKPTWESRNEGIHERVSFEDCIWGFDLAGGSFYKTPLRVTHVKADSRAEKAGIRPGDKLKRINDIDTSTLTIQEAHKIILESGIHLKIAVTAPEDEEDAYYCYEDPIEDGYDSEEERRKEEEKARKRQVHARVSSYWSLQWPWVSKRRVIYRESNCFMVPSKYEDKHKDQFPAQTIHKIQDDIVLDSFKNVNLKNDGRLNENNPSLPNGGDIIESKNAQTNNVNNVQEKKLEESTQSVGSVPNGNTDFDKNGSNQINNSSNNESHSNEMEDIMEVDEDKIPVTPEPQQNGFEDISEADSEPVPEVPVDQLDSVAEGPNGDANHNDDKVIEELFNGADVTNFEQEQIIDNILSDSHDEDTVDSVDER